MSRRQTAQNEIEMACPKPARLRRSLLKFYDSERRDLPWRQTSDPYAILVSEIMLQQTQVATVIPRWHAFLEEFPTFEDEIEKFMAFVRESPLIIHNAQFDITMINNALKRSGKSQIDIESTICTLEIAKKKFPGSKNNLNALCRRFGISLESREKHGALTDSFLLLQVYNELLGGKQQTLSLKIESSTKRIKRSFNNEKNKIVCATISPEEEESHREMLKTLKNNIW